MKIDKRISVKGRVSLFELRPYIVLNYLFQFIFCVHAFNTINFYNIKITVVIVTI